MVWSQDHGGKLKKHDRVIRLGYTLTVNNFVFS